MAQFASWRLVGVMLIFGSGLAPGYASDSDEIRSGCAGGITGGSAGLTLSRDGHLWRWTRRRAGAEVKQGPLMGTDLDAATRLFERARVGEFNSIEYRESGNMTCWVDLSEKGATHGVYWSDRSAAPELAIRLFDELQELVRALMATSPKVP